MRVSVFWVTFFTCAIRLRLVKTVVTYEDLELDIWFDPDGTGIILDQDEVNDCCARGLIDSHEHALIDEQKSHILTNFKNIIQSIWTEDQ